ncbi:MAG: rhomboid family intramembrane serine protease [Planctomycetes bacterium]|nr:rhomboid family intramembrane serine protease [Planctomycetota bacterium]
MLLILPFRTNIRTWRTPYANYALIAINLIIFFLTWGPHRDIIAGQLVKVPIHHSVERFMLVPNNWHLQQFLSYAFLHGGIWHVIGNMFFLYVFGNNVNDKLGHPGYLALYMAGAVFSGIGHTVFHSSSPIPTLGASGAVAAVTGAYLALYPQTLLTVLYWLFFFIGTMEIPALYFIGFKLIFWDNMYLRQIPNVAYDAHLSGYAFGVLAILVMLATGVITGSSLDLWAMIKQWNRRRQHRDSVSSGYDPFSGQTMTKKIKVKEVKKTAAQQQQEDKIAHLRNEISSRIAQRNMPAAAKVYLDIMDLDSKQILPRQYLLDIANQLASDNNPDQAAQAYEQFLTHYSKYEYVEQVELMLGILYSRYLQKPELAAKHLQAAVKKLSDPGQLKMCQEELEKLKK